MEERLHKILAHAGYGSRRACESLVAEGRVSVNGRVVTVGDKAALGRDDIRVDGRRVKPERIAYFLLNKPLGYLSTTSDPHGRLTVLDLLTGVHQRVYPVGRLDADSQGLLILTNDGDLAAKLTHPRYGVPKTYQADVAGRIAPEHLQKLMAGVHLSEGRTAPCRIRVLRRGATNSLLEFTLHEGMNCQIRRMLAKFGYHVRRLTRTAVGPLQLRGLGPGKFRQLTPQEVQSLYNRAAGHGSKRRRYPAPVQGSDAAAGALPGQDTRQRAAKFPPSTKPEPRPDFDLARRRKVRDFTG